MGSEDQPTVDVWSEIWCEIRFENSSGRRWNGPFAHFSAQPCVPFGPSSAPLRLLLPISQRFQAIADLARPCRSDCTPRKRLTRAGKGKLSGIPSKALELTAWK